MIRDFALSTFPPRRIEQIRAVRDHLRRAIDSVKEPPAGLPEPTVFARTAANAVKSIMRVYADLGTSEEREVALRSLMTNILVESHYWSALESPYARHDLGDELHPFALGSARYGAGDAAGAIAAFGPATHGPHAAFAKLCIARVTSVGLEDERKAQAILQDCVAAQPGYMPALMELASVAYRIGDYATANARIDAIREPLEKMLREAPRAANVPNLDVEVSESLANKTLVRPKGQNKDIYSETMCEWYWRDMWWHMNTLTRYQHGLGWLRWVYETTIDGILAKDPSIDTVIDFGVLCAEPEFRLSKKYPHVTFYGVDREQVTKKMNDITYGSDKLQFIAGNIDDHLGSIVKRGTTLLFHGRTGTLCYPQFLRNLYKHCAEVGVKTIALFENNALERRSYRYWSYDDMPADALPYIEKMFIHNYKRYLEEAGYRVASTRRLPYTDLFHASQDFGCDGHIAVVATHAAS